MKSGQKVEVRWPWCGGVDGPLYTWSEGRFYYQDSGTTAMVWQPFLDGWSLIRYSLNAIRELNGN